VTILCALVAFVNVFAYGDTGRQESAALLSIFLMFILAFSFWSTYASINDAILRKIKSNEPAEPEEVLLKITVRNNRDGKDFTYAADNEFGLNYSYEYDRRGQEFLRIVKELKDGSLTLAILTEHDVIDVKYGFYTTETVK